MVYKKKSFADNEKRIVTPDQSIEIQGLRGKKKQIDIAEDFGISQSRVSQIMNGDFKIEEEW